MTLPKGFEKKAETSIKAENLSELEYYEKKQKLDFQNKLKTEELEKKILAEWKALDPKEYDRRVKWIDKYKELEFQSEEGHQKILNEYEKAYLELEKKWDEQEIGIWKKHFENYEKTVDTVKGTFSTLKIMNIVIFSIGVFLLGNGIYMAYTNSGIENYWSYISGGLGAASFFSIWFLRPQNYIAKALGNMIQADIMYKTHHAEWEFVKLYYHDRLAEIADAVRNGDIEISMIKTDLIKTHFDNLKLSTDNYVKMIQEYIEKPIKENDKVKVQ